jgi:Fe-S oxidoreductase
LRRALGKEITDEDVLRVAKKAGELGMRLKLYLMVGLPCERPADLEEVTSLMKEVRKGRGGRLAQRQPIHPQAPDPPSIQPHGPPRLPKGED